MCTVISIYGVLICIHLFHRILALNKKNTAKLYGDALLYTAVFIDWLDLLDCLDSRSPAIFID